MVETGELGLSLGLSLAFPDNRSSAPQPIRMPSAVSSSFSPSQHFNPSDRSLERYRDENMPFLRGIDVNRSPATAECEEEAGVSSPNSTISSVSGKRSEREATGDDNEFIRGCSRGISDEEDGDGCRKKLRLSKDQAAVLEESFKEHITLNPKQKLALAKRLGLRPRQVEVWFQNRRARTKLKQTEVDCEYMKRCCENLTEMNRRLQKEVQELRALKHSPQFYMQMAPPTTLTMCPSCLPHGSPATAESMSRHQTPQMGVHAASRHRPLPVLNPWLNTNRLFIPSVASHGNLVHHRV